MISDFEWRLLPGERIVWAGQPGHGLRLMPADLFLTPFSLMWGGFAIFWEGSVLALKTPFFFKLWGIPFVLVGLYLIFGRFFFDAWLRRRTHYALTNQRVLVERSGLFGTLTALDLDRLPQLQLRVRRNGSGTITFGQNSMPWGRGFPAWSPSMTGTPQFLAIDDARSVYDIIQRTARRSA